MSDEQFRALRQLILDQSVKIEALALEVRRLKQAVETTEVVYVEDPRINSDEFDDLLRTRRSPGPHNDN